MAENVHRNLEETLPELEQLERVGLFSRDEIKSIIKRRTAHEYRMNRLKNDKEDFLKYIEYEKHLLNLIKKRRKKIKYYFKETEIEHAIVVRIQRLYRRLCTLFPHDLTIWLSHIRFLHEWNRMGRLSQLFTKLLKVNSRIPGLWILAAKTQLEYNNNPDDARRLLLRALRHHPNSQKLWTEYFRMELLHAYKLNKRMAILQQSQMSLEEDEASLLKGKLAKLVYKSALKTIPDNIQFRLQFAKISEEFDFTRDITDEIYDDLLADHPDKELTWKVLARRPLTFLDKKAKATQVWQTEQNCHKIFEDGLTKINSEAMWSLFITFCYERLQLKESRDISDKRVAHLLKLFERASSQFTLSEEDFIKWSNVLIHTGQLEEASRVAEKATTAYSQSAKIWEMRLQLAARIASEPKEKDKEHVRSLFDSAISSVKSKNALNIWMVGLEWCLLYDEERVTALFEAGCEEHRNVSLPLKECYLEYAATTGGIKKARKVYKKLQIKKPLSVEFYKKKILLENTQPQVNISKLRETYEDALKEFGSHDPDLWLDYIKMESSLQQIPSLENVKKLHWRAKSALEGMNVEKFIIGYTLLQLSQ